MNDMSSGLSLLTADRKPQRGPSMRTTVRNGQRLEAILIPTITLASQLLLDSPVLGAVGDKAEVSPVSGTPSLP